MLSENFKTAHYNIIAISTPKFHLHILSSFDFNYKRYTNSRVLTSVFGCFDVPLQSLWKYYKCAYACIFFNKLAPLSETKPLSFLPGRTVDINMVKAPGNMRANAVRTNDTFGKIMTMTQNVPRCILVCMGFLFYFIFTFGFTWFYYNYTKHYMCVL